MTQGRIQAGGVARGAEALPSFKLVNKYKYHLYIPVYVYCTDNTVRARHASHKNDITYF